MTKSKTIGEKLAAAGYDNILVADGFDAAFLGIGHRCGQPAIAVYDRAKSIRILMKDMNREEAEEYFEFNVVGAWVGEQTPLFLVGARFKGVLK